MPVQIKREGFKHIDKIGIEIEGAWLDKIPYQFIYDGSVHIDEDVDEGSYIPIEDNDCGCGDEDCSSCYEYEPAVSSTTYKRIGESRSKPMGSSAELIQYIDGNYPDKVNKTCGLHIHVSFKKKNHYALLMGQEFYDYFLDAIEKFGNDYPIKNQNFWDRLNGSNTYCKRLFTPEVQAKTSGKNGDRYTHLNYCYRLHKTIECRLFPAFKSKETALSAINTFINIVEDYIDDNNHLLKRFEVSDIAIPDNTNDLSELINDIVSGLTGRGVDLIIDENEVETCV